MDSQEIIKAVNAIEQDIYESSNTEYFNITFSTNGYVDIVEFCGIRLWDSESDDRPYADESDESTREPIERHLRRRLNEEIRKIKNIMV